MRIWLPVSLALLFLNSNMLYAAETLVSGTTLLRFEQRSLPGFDKQQIIPATQFISLEAAGVGEPNLSVHLNGWGRADLADNSSDKSSDGSLSYGYLRYLFPKSNAEVKAGRLFVFEGVSSENIDGLYLKTELTNGFAISAFGGAPVHPANSVDNRGDYIYGGRLSYLAPSFLELGISSLYEQGLISGPITNLRDTRQLLGADFWLKPHQIADLKGRLSYDTINRGIAEQSWLLALKAGSISTVTIHYSQYEFKELFAASSLRSLFNPDIAGKQKTVGASYNLQISKPFELTASFKHYDRDTTGTADRYGAEGRLSLLSGKGLSGFSYFRISAPTGVNSFHEARAYMLYDTAVYSTSIDGIMHLYDEAINGKASGFELQGSTGYRLRPDLKLSCDLSYAQNPAYSSEVKGMVRLTFNYNSGRGAAK